MIETTNTCTHIIETINTCTHMIKTTANSFEVSLLKVFNQLNIGLK